MRCGETRSALRRSAARARSRWTCVESSRRSRQSGSATGSSRPPRGRKRRASDRVRPARALVCTPRRYRRRVPHALLRIPGAAAVIAVPLGRAQAFAFIDRVHRHHRPPQGWKFGIGASVNGELVGVVVVGRPVARRLDDGFTAEVTRLATTGVRNACSFLYAAARRAAFAMGYRRLVTYILASEPGTSLRAAGWTRLGLAGGGTWCRPSRHRTDKAPTERKAIWETRA